MSFTKTENSIKHKQEISCKSMEEEVLLIYETISIFSFTCKTFKSNMADYQGTIILFIIWLVSTIVVRAIVSKKQNKTNRPPSPLALPIIGHLHLLAPIPHQALDRPLHNGIKPVPNLLESFPEPLQIPLPKEPNEVRNIKLPSEMHSVLHQLSHQ